MPELPEVETIRRGLAPHLVGREIRALEAFTPEVLENPLGLSATGRRIRALSRQGKYLLLHLDDAVDLLVHLRMTGKLLWLADADDTSRAERDPFLRARLTLDQGQLRFEDVRRFGRLYLLPQGERPFPKGYRELGPDAFEPPYDPGALVARLAAHPEARIKALLLRQDILAGLGNIYADEALFRARLNPARPCGTISRRKLFELARLIPPLLAEAIGQGGTSFRDYVDGLGQKGRFVLTLAVYGRQGLPCPRCGRPIEKTVVAGRGTHYCRHCQR